MADKAYQLIEVVGTAKTSIEDAIENALQSLKGEKVLRWFEVLETRGYIEDHGVSYYQVTVKIGCHA